MWVINDTKEAKKRLEEILTRLIEGRLMIIGKEHGNFVFFFKDDNGNRREFTVTSETLIEGVLKK